MNRKGNPALVFFVVLSLGGVVALFSQAGVSQADPARLRAFNTSPSEARLFGEALPAALDAAGNFAAPDAGGGAPGQRKRLSLRCK